MPAMNVQRTKKLEGAPWKRYTLIILSSDPGEARTHDPMIKSHLLYQLSYGVVVVKGPRPFVFDAAKICVFCYAPNKSKKYLPKICPWDAILPDHTP